MFLLRRDEWKFSAGLRENCRAFCSGKHELRGRVGIVPAGHDTPSHTFNDNEGDDKPEYKEDAGVDYDVHEVAIVLWNVSVGGFVLLAHTK